MFTTVTKSGVGMYIVILTTILQMIGVDVDGGTLTEAILAILNGAGAILWAIGTVLRKDTEWGIFRREV